MKPDSSTKAFKASVARAVKRAPLRAVPDPDNPELTKAQLARGVLRPGRGAQKAPTKLAVALRLDRDIVERLRASGDGWQTRVNDMLRAALSAFK
jgi:uncharacterized protein (DUF4415 family)